MVKNKKLISKEETKKNKTPIMEAKMEPAHKTLMQMEIKVWLDQAGQSMQETPAMLMTQKWMIAEHRSYY